MDDAAIEKMRSKRKQVAMELLTTEETYVKNLQDMMNVFCSPMEKNANGSEDKRVISKDDVRTIFGNVKIILPINKMLLADLKEQLSGVNEGETILIGKAFKNMAYCLRSYVSYCTDFETSRKILQQHKENPQFVSFFQSLHDKTIIGNSTLKDYLIMPVQRVPRYRMLLAEILKNTWEGHSDYEPLREALSNISATAQVIENAQEKFNNYNKIIKIQQSIKQSKKEERISLLKPDRLFIMKKNLGIRNMNTESEFHNRMLILFDDLLLITKTTHDSKKKKKLYRVVKQIPLADVTSVVVTTAGKPSVSILCEVGAVYTVQLENEEERQKWFDKLSSLQRVAVEKQKFKDKYKSSKTELSLNMSPLIEHKKEKEWGGFLRSPRRRKKTLDSPKGSDTPNMRNSLALDLSRTDDNQPTWTVTKGSNTERRCTFVLSDVKVPESNTNTTTEKRKHLTRNLSLNALQSQNEIAIAKID